MSQPSPISGLPGAHAVAASRERAVTRLSRGMTAIYAGGASLFAVALGDIVGISGIGIQAAQFGSALLIWLGCLLMISGVPHLARFGTRRGVVALSSLAAAGVSGLVAVAEMFESFFLDSTLLQGLDKWALAVSVVLIVVAGILLGLGPMQDRATGSDP